MFEPVEHPSLESGPRRLTIGMATYDDYDGVYFTVQAIPLYHPEVTLDTEILVIDNHPEGRQRSRCASWRTRWTAIATFLMTGHKGRRRRKT